MAIIYTYSNVTPEPTDLLVITDVSDNNYTKSSTITAAIAATIAAGQNIWFTTSGAGVITINSADFTLSGQNNAFVPRKWGTVLTKDDNGALTTTFSSIRAIQTGDAQGPDGLGAALGVSTGRAFDMSNFDADNTSVLEIYEYAGGSNVGYVPDGGTATDLLNGAGGWTPAASLVAGWTASDDATVPNTVLVGDGTTFEFSSSGSALIAGIKAEVSNAPNNRVFFNLVNNGGSPSNTTFYRGDGQWVTPAGGGTVTSVGATNGLGASSPITFSTTPSPIVAAGTVDIGYSGAIGDIIYADGANTINNLGIGNAGDVLTVSGGLPSWQPATGGGGMTSWTLSGDGGTPQTVTDGNTVDIAGGTVINTSAGATDTVTVNHDAVTRTNTTATATPSFGSTVTTVGQITTSTEGHVTDVERLDITFPANPAQPAVDWNNNLALIGARTANVTTTGATCIWAQGQFTSNQAQYKLIDDYCYLEFDLQFVSVAGWGATPTPQSMYALVNLPFNVAQPTEFEQGFGIVTEATGAFAGHLLTQTTIPAEPPFTITQFQDSKRGDRGSVNSFSAPPATLIPGGAALPAWVVNTWNGTNTNYMCFTYPNFFQGNIELTPHYALRAGAACNIRGNIIYRVSLEQPPITPPDGDYASDG